MSHRGLAARADGFIFSKMTIERFLYIAMSTGEEMERVMLIADVKAVFRIGMYR